MKGVYLSLIMGLVLALVVIFSAFALYPYLALQSTALKGGFETVMSRVEEERETEGYPYSLQGTVNKKYSGESILLIYLKLADTSQVDNITFDPIYIVLVYDNGSTRIYRENFFIDKPVEVSKGSYSLIAATITESANITKIVIGLSSIEYFKNGEVKNLNINEIYWDVNIYVTPENIVKIYLDIRI